MLQRYRGMAQHFCLIRYLNYRAPEPHTVRNRYSLRMIYRRVLRGHGFFHSASVQTLSKPVFGRVLELPKRGTSKIMFCISIVAHQYSGFGKAVLTQATVGGPILGLLFQWLGVTRAINPFVPMQSYVFFMFYIDEINPQCKGDLSCAKPSA